MSLPLMFEKPLGMIDTLPALYERTGEVRRDIECEVKSWGYRPIQTPSLEYYDTVGEASAILDQQLFKLMDREGQTLVLRPDMTAPIARVVSSSMQDEPLPIRLSYCSSLFRAQQREGGRRSEFEQFGVELVGDSTINGDAEVIALLQSSLRASGLSNFRLAVGHIGFMNALFAEIVADEAIANELKRYLYEKNYVGYRQYVERLDLTTSDKTRLNRVHQLRGSIEVLNRAKEIAHTREAHEAIAEIEALWKVLETIGVSEYMQVDLNLVMHIDYYTGVVFEGYGGSLGFPLASGGRYDELLGKFGRPASATGFGIRLDRLIEAVNHLEGERKANPVLVLFCKEQQQEAMREAHRRRKQGEAVVLQNIAGIPDVDAYIKRYSEVVSFLDTGSRREKEDE